WEQAGSKPLSSYYFAFCSMGRKTGRKTRAGLWGTLRRPPILAVRYQMVSLLLVAFRSLFVAHPNDLGCLLWFVVVEDCAAIRRKLPLNCTGGVYNDGLGHGSNHGQRRGKSVCDL